MKINSKLITFDPLKEKCPVILHTKTKAVSNFNNKIFKDTIIKLNISLDELIKTYGAVRGIGLSAPNKFKFTNLSYRIKFKKVYINKPKNN